MDLVPHVGVGPVRFGMKRDDVLSVFGSKQTWEQWMGGNLNDSLFYPGVILYFDKYDSYGPLSEGRLVQIETNTAFPGTLFGRSLAKLCRADIIENVGAHQVKTFPNGSVEVPALDMQFWFTPEDRLDLVRFADGGDMHTEERVEPGIETPGQFLTRFLVKTAFRSVLWLLIAYAVTYFYPSQTWVWYVAVAFIVIALAFGLGVKVLASRAASTGGNQ